MNWKSYPNCSMKEKERNNKVWGCIRDCLIDFKSSLVILIMKKKED